MKQTLHQYLLEQVCNYRCGLALPHYEIESSFSDITGIYNVACSYDINEFENTANGGISFDRNQAICAAIAESLERYNGVKFEPKIKKYAEIKNKTKLLSHNNFSFFSEEQYLQKEFPFKKAQKEEVFYGEVYSLYDNESFWIPHEIIGLSSRNPKHIYVPSTSTGLSAHFDPYLALLKGLQEVLERDALSVTWLNSLPGREVEVPKSYQEKVEALGGKIQAFDLTQDWNPHPVIAMCGSLPMRGLQRISLGVACRETFTQACEKAFLEWMQGVLFAGYFHTKNPEKKFKQTQELISFEDHAAYYTYQPDEWEKIPLLHQTNVQTRPQSIQQEDSKKNRSPNDSPKKVLEDLIKTLQQTKVRLFYKDLTLPDVAQTGLTVVRVISPDLAFLHGDERIPFLGGTCANVAWRYADLADHVGKFPNPYPHPLG